MSRQDAPLPLDADGNGRRLATMQFDVADAYMMSRAMLIAANAAMMSGGEDAERRLRFYRQQFEEHAPPLAKLLRHQIDLSNIAIAMDSNPAWSIHRILEWEWSKTGRVVISCGEGRWYCSEMQDEDGVSMIADMLAEIAPMSCERCIVPDVLEVRRRYA